MLDSPRNEPAHLFAGGFHELIGASAGDDVVALAFALSLAARAPKNLCFCSAGGEAQERGELYGHGLAGLGIQPERMLMITAAKEKDLLWTLEEAVASGAFGAVVGSLGARERLYGFSASRRLKLRAAASQTPLFLLRHRSNGGTTAAQAVGAYPPCRAGPKENMPATRFWGRRACYSPWSAWEVCRRKAGRWSLMAWLPFWKTDRLERRAGDGIKLHEPLPLAVRAQ